jgi:hypothetical protein
MVLTWAATSLAKRGGKPPSPRAAIAMMAALLALQIGWTTSRSRAPPPARLGDWTRGGEEGEGEGEDPDEGVAPDARRAPRRDDVVEPDGFSLAVGAKRRGRVSVHPPRAIGLGFEQHWLGEADAAPRSAAANPPAGDEARARPRSRAPSSEPPYP